MDAVKAGCGGGFFTNYFNQEFVGDRLLSCRTDRTVLFLNDEYDFYRFYYFTTDPSDIARALKELSFPGAVVASYLTKAIDPRIPALFLESGFEHIAVFQRMTNNKLRAGRTNQALCFATEGDVDELHAGLFSVFNKYTDHLPTKAKLAKFIAGRQVIVNRAKQGIVGCIVFQIQGNRVNFNHLYDRSGDSIATLMLLSNFYGLMRERGIHAGFLWVNSTNVGVINLQRNFGWSFDGLQDHFYLKGCAAQ